MFRFVLCFVCLLPSLAFAQAPLRIGFIAAVGPSVPASSEGSDLSYGFTASNPPITYGSGIRLAWVPDRGLGWATGLDFNVHSMDFLAVEGNETEKVLLGNADRYALPLMLHYRVGGANGRYSLQLGSGFTAEYNRISESTYIGGFRYADDRQGNLLSITAPEAYRISAVNPINSSFRATTSLSIDLNRGGRIDLGALLNLGLFRLHKAEYYDLEADETATIDSNTDFDTFLAVRQINQQYEIVSRGNYLQFFIRAWVPQNFYSKKRGDKSE
ncbi:MAG: hypothetical protein ACFB10_00530 [Salibacteraceae bacterium]